MPWLDYTPEDIDLIYWGMHPVGVNHKVAIWPRPNSLRVDARYRMPHGHDCQASAQRFLIRSQFHGTVPPPLPSPVDLWAWIDLEVVDGGHIEASLGPQGDGIDLRMSVRSYDSLPSSGLEGVRMEIEHSIAGFGSMLYWEEYWTEPLAFGWNRNAENWVSGGQTQGFIVDPLWPYQILQPKFQSASECYNFPRQSVPVELMAEFNGVDSWIALDNNIAGFAGPFMLEARIRLHDVTSFWPILGRDNSGGFFGMDEDDGIFGTLRLTTAWLPVLDEWFWWRWEFEQFLQLQHKLFIDDVEVMDRTSTRQFSQFNVMGVYRHGLPGPIWGNFDMQHLKRTTGIPGNHVVDYHYPLTENALDISPTQNHGTTFNMTLPST